MAYAVAHIAIFLLEFGAPGIEGSSLLSLCSLGKFNRWVDLGLEVWEMVIGQCPNFHDNSY